MVMILSSRTEENKKSMNNQEKGLLSRRNYIFVWHRLANY